MEDHFQSTFGMWSYNVLPFGLTNTHKTATPQSK